MGDVTIISVIFFNFLKVGNFCLFIFPIWHLSMMQTKYQTLKCDTSLHFAHFPICKRGMHIRICVKDKKISHVSVFQGPMSQHRTKIWFLSFFWVELSFIPPQNKLWGSGLSSFSKQCLVVVNAHQDTHPESRFLPLLASLRDNLHTERYFWKLVIGYLGSTFCYSESQVAVSDILHENT